MPTDGTCTHIVQIHQYKYIYGYTAHSTHVAVVILQTADSCVEIIMSVGEMAGV